jgi:antirestriction protein ArdC
MTTSSTERFDVHQAITNQIIAAIDAGTGKLQMPWHRSGANIMRPVNAASGNAYRGVNTVALWAAADAIGYEHGLWGTYRQWQDRGAQVRKGEKSSLIVFYRELDSDDADDSGNDDRRRRCMARASRVFNIAQVDGYVIDDPTTDDNRVDSIASAEAFVVATGAKFSEGGDRAFYSIRDDAITMPDRFRFIDTRSGSATEGYYATLLHELTHWTGAPHRLDRQFGERFGDDAYAMEELVAELGAAFLCGDLGISAEPHADHAAYIDSWLRILKGDRKAIFAAASAASRATEFLSSFGKTEVRSATT